MAERGSWTRIDRGGRRKCPDEFASGIMEKPQENCDDSAEFPGMVQQLRPSGNTFLESPGRSY